MSIYSKFVEFINTIIKYIVVVFIGVIAVTLFIQVCSRFIFHTPIAWTDELARYSAVWMVFLASSIVLKNGEFLGIEAVISRVPDVVKKLFRILTYVFEIIFISVVIYFGIKMVSLTGMQNSSMLPISMSVVYMAVPVGMSCCLLNVVDMMLEDLSGRKKVA